jgi:carbonic anhydrase
VPWHCGPSAIVDYSGGAKADLTLPPARGFAVLNRMDARLDPAKYAGLSEGDAHVIRNAGGRASDDAIRSLVISYKLLGTKEWFVIHHIYDVATGRLNEVPDATKAGLPA